MEFASFFEIVYEKLGTSGKELRGDEGLVS